MALTITNNVSSLTAQNNLSRTTNALNTSLERLSSGLKINRGADGPAALIISEEQRAQINGLQSAITNTSNAVSLVQTGEGALNEIASLLDKIRGLAVDSSNIGVNDSTALAANQSEINNALQTINNIASQTQFGQKHLLDGTVGQQITTTVGSQNLSSVTATPDTAPGTYTVNVVQQGVKGQVTGTSNFTALTNSVSVTSGAANISGTPTVTNSTVAGLYNIQFVQQGVKSNITANTAAATETGTENLTISGGGISGTVNVQFVNNDTAANQVTKINTALTTAGVTNYTASLAASGKIQIVANAFGATPSGLTVASDGGGGNGSGFATGAGQTGQAGANLQVSVNGGTVINGSGANGDQISVTSGPATGLAFTAASGAGAFTTTAASGATSQLNITGTDLLTLNGTQIQLNAQNANTLTAAISTINSFSTQTGVTASANGSKLQLTANAFGGNVSETDSGTAGGFAGGAGVTNTSNGQALIASISNGTTSTGNITGSGTTGNAITGTTGAFKGLTFNIAPSSQTQTVAGGSTATTTIQDGLTFQIGANFGQTASISINKVSTDNLGVNVSGLNNAATTSLSKIDVTDPTGKNAEDAIKVVDQAISDVSTLRGRLGAFQANTLESNVNNLRTTLENTTAAESTIRDTDFAAETANYTKSQVLVQAGTAVLKNANQTTQLVLGLLQ
ncbi:MAG TPA: flagellin [Gemmataceae bacterium]|nr:flagellin [Gemmataceae bacterium]